MVRFILAGVLCSIVSAALVPLSAAEHDSDPPPWWHMALAQTSADRQAPEKMRGLQERLNLTVVGSPRLYASDILGNVALESELTIARLDAEGAEVILTYKQGSRMGATVLNQRVIMLNVPKDVPVKSFKIIYPHTAAGEK